MKSKMKWLFGLLLGLALMLGMSLTAYADETPPYEATVSFYTAAVKLKLNNAPWETASVVLDDGVNVFTLPYKESADGYGVYSGQVVKDMDGTTERPYKVRVAVQNTIDDSLDDTEGDRYNNNYISESNRSVSQEFFDVRYSSYQKSADGLGFEEKVDAFVQHVRSGSCTVPAPDMHVDGLVFRHYGNQPWRSGPNTYFLAPAFDYENNPITESQKLYAIFDVPCVWMGELIRTDEEGKESGSGRYFRPGNLAIVGFTDTPVKSAQILTGGVDSIRVLNTSGVTLSQGPAKRALDSGSVATDNLLNITFGTEGEGWSAADARDWIRENLVFTPAMGRTCNVNIYVSEGVLSDGLPGVITQTPSENAPDSEENGTQYTITFTDASPIEDSEIHYTMGTEAKIKVPGYGNYKASEQIFLGWQVQNYGSFTGSAAIHPWTGPEQTLYASGPPEVTLPVGTGGDITLVPIVQDRKGISVDAANSAEMEYKEDMKDVSYYPYTVRTTLDGEPTTALGPLTLISMEQPGNPPVLTPGQDGVYSAISSYDTTYEIASPASLDSNGRVPRDQVLGTVSKGSGGAATLAFETLKVRVIGNPAAGVKLYEKDRGPETDAPVPGPALTAVNYAGKPENETLWQHMRQIKPDAGNVQYEVYIDGVKAPLRSSGEADGGQESANAVYAGYGREVVSAWHTATVEISEGLTLTISAPTGNLVYDGTTTYPAVMSIGYNTTAFPGTYSISYTKDGSAYSGVPKDPGTYTASVTAGTGDTAKTASVSYTIDKASATVTKAPEAKTLTYNDSAKELVTAGEATGGEMQYALGTATEATQPYTTSIATATEAGTYYVWYKVPDTEYYNGTEPEKVSVTIDPAAVTLTANSGTATYTGAEQAISGFTASVEGLTFAETVTASGKGTNAGAYDVTFSGVKLNETRDSTGNYVVKETFGGKLTINKANSTVATAPTAKSLTYTGEAQALITAGSGEGGTIQYAVTADETEPADKAYTFTNESLPTGTDVKTYYVWYKVFGDGNHNSTAAAHFAVRIKEADAGNTASTADKLVYNGEAQPLVEPGSATGGTLEYALGDSGETAPENGWSENVPQGTDVGTYHVWYRVLGDANHNDVAPACVDVEIAKAPISPTISITGWNYGQSANAPSVTGNTGGGAVTYAYSDKADGTYAEAVPTNAGTWYVKATVAETANYLGATTDDISFAIARATATVTANSASKTAGENDPALTATVTGLVNGDAASAITYTVTRAAGEEAGTYAITPAGEATQGNYAVTYVEGTLTIAAKPGTQPEPQPVQDEGDYSFDVEEQPGAPKVEAEKLPEAETNKLMTAEEKQLKEAGASVNVTVETTPLSEGSVPERDKNLIALTAKDMGGNMIVGMYIDISMYMKVGDGAPRQVTELNGATLKLRIEIPKELLNGQYTDFAIIQTHDGKTQVHSKRVGDAIELELTELCTFALVYKEVKAEPQPQPDP